ncbi:DoxX family membrane protein [Hamadaea tsunoensis]|uniref:DoxX family membrane protein n=1 Tax=Hamadaea tsunoensis TaxID=53368 RepID=UPI00040612CF|nr:DoxX family membrane protein [Hamadaea tsunoensis]
MAPVRSIARALLGGVFIASGAQALLRANRYAHRAQPLADQVAPLINRIDERLPTSAEALVRVNAAAQLGGGLLLATGTAPRPAAALLAGTLVPATIATHPFWRARTQAPRQVEMVHFAKNMAILGGLLLAIVDTGGAPSVGWRVRRYFAERSAAAEE